MPYEKLSEREINAIGSYIDDYAIEGASRTATVAQILKPWAYYKQNLFHLLGDNLIISKYIEYEKSPNELASDMREFIMDERKSLYNMFHPFSELYRECVENKIYKESEYSFSVWRNLISLVDSSVLAKNIYEGENFTITLPNGKPYKIFHGQKVMKILAKIASAYNIEGFENFRLAHSQVLNNKKFSGELCLSIHPLDFMTMSDNENDWSSCMSWRDHGDYRMGTVEMMNSDCVIMAYLKSKDNKMYWNDYEWNSKTWRELFIVKDDMLVGIKGYPVWNIDLQRMVLEWLAELSNREEERFDTDVIQFSYDNGAEVEGVELEFATEFMYNDFSYDSHAIILANDIRKEYHFIKYSGPAECMACGEIHADFEYNDCSLLTCCSCYQPVYCRDCGAALSEDDVVYFEGEPYCQYCYERIPVCEECGEMTNDYYTVSVAVDDEHIYRQGYYTLSYCNDCFNKLLEKGIIKRREYTKWYGSIYYILIDDLGKDVFEEKFSIEWEDRYNDPEFGFYQLVDKEDLGFQEMSEAAEAFRVFAERIESILKPLEKIKNKCYNKL